LLIGSGSDRVLTEMAKTSNVSSDIKEQIAKGVITIKN
jgi:hypothetical protein